MQKDQIQKIESRQKDQMQQDKAYAKTTKSNKQKNWLHAIWGNMLFQGLRLTLKQLTIASDLLDLLDLYCECDPTDVADAS